jgi:hypothetical protein
MAELGQKIQNRSAANSGRIPFAPAYVPELYDSRLSSDEKILLWKIRYRAGVKGATWISWETMAEESSKGRSTIMRQIKKLRDLGFLTTESRGFGRTTDKIVECPTEIYPQDLCDSHTVGKYFRKDRDPETLQELISASLSSPIGETTGDNDDSQGPRKSQIWDLSSPKSGTSVVPEMRLELDKRELDKSKLDPSPSGRRESQQAGPLTVGEDIPNEELEPKTPFVPEPGSNGKGKKGSSPTADERLADAREIQGATSAKTLATAREKFEQRRLSKAERDATGLTEARKKHLEELAKDNRKPAFNMAEFFKPVFLDYFPRDPFATWMKREYTQANSLLNAYDGDFHLVCEAWVYTCVNWDEIKKKLRLTEGYPNIGTLLALHARIFPMLSKSKTKREDVESQRPKRKIGW